MKGYRPHTVAKINIILIILLFISFNGCKEEKLSRSVVARVNKVYLYEDDVEKAIGNYEQNRNLFVKRWVETELTYQDAIKNDILEDSLLVELLERNKKEIIASYWMSKKVENMELDIQAAELEKFYNENRETFALTGNAFYLNKAVFNSEAKAINFRNALLSNDWDLVEKKFLNDSLTISIEKNILVYEYQINTGSILRVLQEMVPFEISLVLKVGNNNYAVYQMLSKFSKSEIPPFKVIKSEVEKRYKDFKRKTFYEDYVKSLYENNNVEIIR